ncbi:MAG: hypothetical protein GXO83_12500 [Chlorobi bacterium]|nr:hypothetical protein [Chlorobiota bacterium]
MSKEKAVFHIPFHVMVSQTGKDGMLTLAGISDFMQEAAARHAGKLGLGFDAIRKHGQAWFLRQLRIRYLKPVKWGDELTVETWPLPPDGLVFFRDFKVFNREEVLVAEGSSGWMLISLENMKPVNMVPEQFETIHFREDRVFPEPFPRIPGVKKMDKTLDVQVKYRFLDLNGHVNHVNYIRWLLDLYYLFSKRISFPSEFNIRFQQEMKEGQSGIAGGTFVKESNLYTFHIVRPGDHTEVIRASLHTG